jgi:hypothetical protein
MTIGLTFEAMDHTQHQNLTIISSVLKRCTLFLNGFGEHHVKRSISILLVVAPR